MKHCVEIWCNDCQKQIGERLVNDGEKSWVRATCRNERCDRGTITIVVIAQEEEENEDEDDQAASSARGWEFQPRDIHSDLYEDR